MSRMNSRLVAIAVLAAPAVYFLAPTPRVANAAAPSIISSTSATDASDFKNLLPNCPGGGSATGAGASLSGANGEVFISHWGARSNGARLTAQKNVLHPPSGGGGTSWSATSQAICHAMPSGAQLVSQVFYGTNNFVSGIVSCPVGKVPLGGQIYPLTGSPTGSVQNFKPIYEPGDDRGHVYASYGRNTARPASDIAEHSINVQVTCVPPPSGYFISSAESSLPPGTSTVTATANCPSGKYVKASGVGFEGGFGLHLTEVYATTTSVRTRFRRPNINNLNEQSYVQAFAICAN